MFHSQILYALCFDSCQVVLPAIYSQNTWNATRYMAYESPMHY